MTRLVDSTDALELITPDGTERIRVTKNGVSKAVLTGDIADADAAAAIAAHVALGDPHTQYLTEAAAAAGYQPLDTDLTAIAALTTTAFGRSVLDRANAAALATLAGVGTGDSPQFTAINLGNASDTTIARGLAGRPTVAGVPFGLSVGQKVVEDFGAVGDGVYKTNGVATSGDNTFTCGSVSWATADIGKPIVVAGAGAAGATLATTIASINSGTSIELTVAPSTSVASAKFYYGTDDTTPIQAALDATTDGQGVLFAPGKIYMAGNIKLPGGTGVFGFKRKFFGCIGGMAELVATTSGDYLVAAKRWTTGDANGAFAEAPFHFAGMVFEAFGLKALGCVTKCYAPLFEFCEFRNATAANWRLTRQNQDGSLGTAAYLSGCRVSHCFSVSTLAGVTVAKGFHTQGTASDEGDAPTDGTFISNEAFGGTGAMTTAFSIGNTGGWSLNVNRTFACATGIDIFACGKNAAWGLNNWDSNAGVAARVRKIGTYIDFAALFQGDTFYTDLWIDFSDDSTTELAVISGAYFWFDPVEPTSGFYSDGQARIIHNNNRAAKKVLSKNNVFQAENAHVRNAGNTLGVFDVEGMFSVEDTTVYQRQFWDSGATGIVDRYLHASASPAANDVLRTQIVGGLDSGGNVTQYVTTEEVIADATDGSEDATWRVNAMLAGTLTRRFEVGPTGAWIGAANTAVPNAGQVGLGVVGTGYGTSGASLSRYSADADGPWLITFKSRGSAPGSNTIINNGDVVARWQARASDGVTSQPVGTMRFDSDGAPGAGDMPGRWVLLLTPDGGSVEVECLRASQNGAVSHRANATIIVDASSHLGLRSYTVATLPSASTAARMIYVSDGTSNKRQAVSDGTNWRWPDGAVVS